MNINKSYKKLIIFDLYGTLACFSPSRDIIQKNVVSKFGYKLSTEGINQGYFEAQKFFDLVNSSTPISRLNSKKKEHFFSKYEQIILKGDGIEVDLKEAGDIWKMISLQPYDMVLYPNVIDVLLKLKKDKFLLGLATNIDQSSKEISKKFNLEGIMDFVFTSKDLKLRKPDINFFKKIISISKVPFTDVVFVGDQIENDIQPAISLGISTILIDRYSQYDKKIICPVIRDIKDIIKLV